MEQLRLHASDLAYLAPELTLVISAVVLSLLDLILPKKVNRNTLGWLSLIGILISIFFVTQQLNMDKPIQLLHESYRIDHFAAIFKIVLLMGAGLITFMSLGSIKKVEVPHVGELYYFMLPATLGGLIMASSGDLVTLFVGLELLSITSYILVGMRKNDLKSNEASFKYVVIGGISSASILYGMSFFYGMSGSTNIHDINVALSANYSSFEPMIYLAFFFLLAGVAFKIAAAPFHMWAPDVYEGAPTPITTFLAVVSKAAGFAILFRIVYGLFSMGNLASTDIHKDVFTALMVLAAISMVVGNVLAVRQKNMKRLFAYSGVAHAGYMLVPLAISFNGIHSSNFTEFMFYLIAYLFMNIGAFAVLMIVNRSVGHNHMSGYAGLIYKAPFTAVAMVLLILSLAGFPISGGFFGKVFIIMGTMETQHYWLAAMIIGTSVISFYYYFSVIRQMFMRTSDDSKTLKIPVPLGVTVWISAIVSVLLGIFPQVVTRYIEQTFVITKDLFM